MKILISAGSFETSLGRGLLGGFKKLGHDAIAFPAETIYKNRCRHWKNRYIDRFFWKSLAKGVQKELLNLVGKENPDLILILKGWLFSPETLIKIKNMNPAGRLFCFNPDNPFNTWHFGTSNDWIRKSIPLYDAYFIWGKFLIDSLRAERAEKVIYLPFAMNPEYHYPVNLSAEEKDIYGSDIAFIGSWDKEREWWLSQLINFDLAIWGNGWHKAKKSLRKKWRGRAILEQEFSRVCGSAKIVLNLIRNQNRPAHNMKTFELPACKAFVLSTATEEMHEFFEDGKEIAYFSTPDELKGKAEYYLAREALRNDLKERGYEKVKNHTYLARVKAIWEVYEEPRFSAPALSPA